MGLPRRFAPRNDCFIKSLTIDNIAYRSNFITKSTTTDSPNFQVLNRLAIEELEAWFFGDVEALHTTYPRISLNLGNKAKYRDPDAITGGTWEALERELKRVGYYSGGLSKISAAREISLHMDPERNRSHSFRVFRQGLLDLMR